MVLDYITNLNAPASSVRSADELNVIHRKLIYRHIAFVNALRLQLRSKSVWQGHVGAETTIINDIDAFHQEELDKEFCLFLPEEEIVSVLK